MKLTDSASRCLDRLSIKQKYRNKINDILRLLEEEQVDIASIILFGSCARGEAVLGSDIDLCVLTYDKLNRYTKGSLQGEASRKDDGVKADLLFFTVEEFSSTRGKFEQAIKKEGIVLWEDESHITNME